MKCVIIELNKYHTETFPIYENLLPAFFCTNDLECYYYHLPHRLHDLSRRYRNVVPVINAWQYFLIRNLGLRVSFFARKIQQIIDTVGADAVVFNSIEPERNQKVFEAVTAKMKIAVIHNPARFSLSRQKNEYFFVLSELLYDRFKGKLPLDGYFLPFFRPRFSADSPVERLHNGIVIGVQGWINFKRRDYDFLIRVARRMKEEGTAHVVFNIIGSNNKKGGKRLREMIRSDCLDPFFRLHESLDDMAFFREIEACDLLMPLLGPAQKAYFQDKTTATFSHAVAYNKPMLLSRQNADAWGLDEGSQFIYDDDETCAGILKNMAATALGRKRKQFEAWRSVQVENNRALLSALSPLHSASTN